MPRYESADADNYVDIVPLKMPTEIPYLAPSQEWRTVWDSALDRKQLGESIGSRFAGAVTFYDQPNSSRQGKTKQKRHQFRTPAVLDWATLHPVERLELLTSHDLARQEKQKLELLRGLLTYYHYATTESRQEALQSEINKINAAANEQRDRYRSQFAVEKDAPQRSTAVAAPAAPVSVDELPPQLPPQQPRAPAPAVRQPVASALRRPAAGVRRSAASVRRGAAVRRRRRPDPGDQRQASSRPRRGLTRRDVPAWLS